MLSFETFLGTFTSQSDIQPHIMRIIRNILGKFTFQNDIQPHIMRTSPLPAAKARSGEESGQVPFIGGEKFEYGQNVNILQALSYSCIPGGERQPYCPAWQPQEAPLLALAAQRKQTWWFPIEAPLSKCNWVLTFSSERWESLDIAIQRES